LTSVGTLTGVTSSRPIVAQQGLRVSGGVISGSTGISGSSAKFSGIVNGGRFVGSGAGLTNITADQTDVTSSTGDISYELAFTEYLGSDVGLGGNAGLAFNPKGLVSQFSSSLIVSGNNGGLPQARLVMGDKDAATLSIGAEAGSMLYKMYSSDASIRISGSHAGGVVLYGGDHAQAGTMVYGGQGLKILNAAGNDANAFISQAGLFSGSNIELDPGAEVKISGVKVLDQTTLGSTVLASSLTSVGTLSSLAVGNVTSTGILSASGDLRLGAGAGIDIGGQANVLSQATLGSTVLASSLTSLGTLNGMTSSMGVKVGGYGLFANDLTRSSGDLNIKLHDAAANHAGFRLANGGFPLKVLSTGVTELNNGEVKVGSSTGTVSGSGQLQFAGAAALNGTLSVNGAITLSGASDTAVAVGSDSIYFRDADGTMKRDTIADLVSAMAGTGLSAASGQLSLSSVGTPNGVGNANATLAEGLNYGTTTLTANRTWTLPASSGLSTGDVIRIKAPADVDTFYIKVTGSGAQKVDGGNPIVYLESDNAAIALHYVATNKFVIF
jgi:hypothetical protein